MKRVISYFVFFGLVSIFTAACVSNGIAAGPQKDTSEAGKLSPAFVEQQQQQKESGTSGDQPGQSKAHLCLYLPEEQAKPEGYLRAVESYVEVKKSLEQTICEQLFPKLGLSGVTVQSIEGKGGILTLGLSANFATKLQALGDQAALAVYSIVNSLTEIPGVLEVRFQTAAASAVRLQKVKPDGVTVRLDSSFRRNRSYLKRDTSLTPSEVLQREMTFEQNGQWLSAYQLMSDDQKNRHKKYYNEFYSELEEMKKLGFLYTVFRIKGYKIDPSGDKSTVELEFIPRNDNPYAQYVDKVHINMVKIDGMWMVDWITSQ